MYVEILNKDGVILPQKGDAGIDLVAADDGTKDKSGKFIEYKTGVRIAPSSNSFHGFIFPRSSISNYDLMLANSVAVIDSSYRGEIKLRFKIVQNEPMGLGFPAFHDFYEKGDKIGQLIFFQPVQPEIVFVDSFENSDTLRGDGGFGSTGK